MLFNSLAFLIFFPIVTILYFLLPHSLRWLHLLIASLIFYMFFVPVYVLILVFTIIVDYYAGLKIAGAQGHRRRAFLGLSIAANVLILGFFKYYNFFNDSFRDLFHHFNLNYTVPHLGILLPIGLSFHTFQAMSYTIEVYRGNQKPERHFGIYALYVMFYPQLVAGPIERPQNLLHQFREKHFFNPARAEAGLRLMLWGFFKKIVIADRLAAVVDIVYNHAAYHHGLSYLVATVFFAFQIYCDFSGYTDIAIGAAKVMGFDLMLNFRRPYFATNIADFWRRWHISLSTWFKDYLYIPLGGNRVPPPRQALNLLIVFLISGLWHGANWTFVIWGLLHGLFLVFSMITRHARQSITKGLHLDHFAGLHDLLSTLLTFALVTLTWIFFRANNLPDAVLILHRIFRETAGAFTALSSPGQDRLGLNALGGFSLIFPLAAMLFLLLVEALQERKPGVVAVSRYPTWARWTVYEVLLLSVIFLGTNDAHQFIYFQF